MALFEFYLSDSTFSTRTVSNHKEWPKTCTMYNVEFIVIFFCSAAYRPTVIYELHNVDILLTLKIKMEGRNSIRIDWALTMLCRQCRGLL